MESSKFCKDCRQEKRAGEFYKHPAGLLGRAIRCIQCTKIFARSQFQKHKTKRTEKSREYKKQWRLKRGIRPAYMRDGSPQCWPELFVPATWRAGNAEYRRLRERLRHELAGRPRNAMKSARRRTCRVAWADEAKIAALYKLAREMTARTGIQHEVDHIIPIKHPLVCGLHVEANMRVVTSQENRVKKNKFHAVIV